LPSTVAIGEAKFDWIVVLFSLLAFLYGTIHHMHVVKFVTGTGLFRAVCVFDRGVSELVEVELSFFNGNLELLELVGLCLQVASSGLIEATLEVRVLRNIRSDSCTTSFASLALGVRIRFGALHRFACFARLCGFLVGLRKLLQVD